MSTMGMNNTGTAVRAATSRGAEFWMLGVVMSMSELGGSGLDGSGLDGSGLDGVELVPRGEGFRFGGGRP